MAAANENQGLKIAVAAFVTLTVVLAVTTYFGFSSYSEASAKLAEAQSAANDANSKQQATFRNMEELLRTAGYPNLDYDAAKAKIAKDQADLKEGLDNLSQAVAGLMQPYREAGGNNQKVEELSQATQRIIDQIRNEPNATFLSLQQRMNELVGNLTQLSTALVLDNEGLRTDLTSVNQVNKEQLQVQLDTVAKAQADLQAEHDAHESARQALLRRNDELSTQNAEFANEINRLNTVVAQLNAESERRNTELLAQLRSYREQLEKDEEIMDVPDGRILYVDHVRNEVRVSLTRGQGARERMHFAVFDRSSPGLPTDKPKGVIELTNVTDSGSTARILRTTTLSDPIRSNDYVYSAAWSADRPMRFALVGKIDIDRDGVDDRDDLKRLIQQAGGVIDYDLPPPGVGQESGELTGLTNYYVLDDRAPLRPPTGSAAEIPGAETSEFLQKKSDVLQEARMSGVRPISIGRLLAYLGYTYGQSAPGQVEAINQPAAERLLNPEGRTGVTPDQATEGDAEILTTPPPGGF